MNSSNTIRSSTIQLVRCYAMLVIGAGPSYFCLVGPNMGLESPAAHKERVTSYCLSCLL